MKALARYQLGKQRHIGVNNLPNVVARQCRSRELNPRSVDRKSETLPLHHRATCGGAQLQWVLAYFRHWLKHYIGPSAMLTVAVETGNVISFRTFPHDTMLNEIDASTVISNL